MRLSVLCCPYSETGPGYACRVCGDPDPGVHHREPGMSVLHLMIALCAGCHAKVHRTKIVLTEFPPLLLELWREQYPEGHEPTYLQTKRLSVVAHLNHRFQASSRYQHASRSGAFA